jgi:hypothetical protein
MAHLVGRRVALQFWQIIPNTQNCQKEQEIKSLDMSPKVVTFATDKTERSEHVGSVT